MSAKARTEYALSAVATRMSLGLLAFSILGGVVADRFSKRRILIIVHGCTAAVMTTVAGRMRQREEQHPLDTD